MCELVDGGVCVIITGGEERAWKSGSPSGRITSAMEWGGGVKTEATDRGAAGDAALMWEGGD